jgi:molecular chaperone GrpE
MTNADGAKDQQAQETEQAEEGAAGTSTAELEAQLQAARDELAQYKDKYLRALAEAENTRKRLERAAAERAERTRRDVVGEFLDVVDNLDRAMTYKDTMDRDALAQTLTMVHNQLSDVLRRQGVMPVESVGQPFNPHLHEAIEFVASSEHPEGTVSGETRKGYTIGNDLLRPARVQVSSGPQDDVATS